MELLSQLDYWHWFVLAILLIILEVFSPGVFFIWMGLAAGIVGLVLLAVPDLSWQFQLVIFAVLSVTDIFAARLILKRRPIKTDQPHLNRRGEQYTGRIFTLQEPIINGEGKIQVDDSTWKIRGDDCPAGSQVKVTGADGVVLIVQSVS
ncbi:MAG: NfeD family protein [Gammaproteobacteria bacterium]|nr:NfeD family protein [Gammaproteobacteria bacterium]